MIPTKKMTPYVPISVEDIVEMCLRAVDIEITMVHLHARDEKTGEPTTKLMYMAGIIAGIRQYAPDLIICVSLSGRTFNRFEKSSWVPATWGEVQTGYGQPDSQFVEL